jgi:SnoaL-like domain
MPISLNVIHAHQRIQQAIARYCHGVDRCDLEMLKSSFWADGMSDYGMGAMPNHAFCDMLLPAVSQMKLTQHHVSNMLININGTRAKVQTYCVAFHILGPTDAEQEMEVGGRYLDEFEERDDEWLIKNRVYVMDWNRNVPSTMTLEGDLYESLTHVGKRKPDDLFYAQT